MYGSCSPGPVSPIEGSLDLSYEMILFPRDALVEQESKACLRTAIASLDPIQRQIYRLREVDELSTQIVAVLTGLSEAGVKSRLHRARIEVRNSVDGMFDLST